MPIRIANPYNRTWRTGVPVFNGRLQDAFARFGLQVPWEHPDAWANGSIKGDPARDIVIVTNEDAILIPPEIAVIAIQHGCAPEYFARCQDPWCQDINPKQIEASKRPRTFWVACAESCAHEYFQHHGYHADRIILNGLDTDRFFPLERQIRKDTLRPVIVHHCADNRKGVEQIGAVAVELGDDFLVRPLDSPPEAVADAMRCADMFLCLSVAEGCPCVVNEALATGLVMVSTDVGLYWRAEDAPPGVRFRWQDRGDAKLVANAVREAWKDRHRLNGRPWALRWLNLGLFAQKYIEAVAEAAARFGVNP